jgi:anti-sigma B factor antagonist
MSDSAGGSSRVLKLETREESGSRVLSASGQLTEPECADFLRALNRMFDSSSTRVILDLKGLMYMSSAGLGALVSVHKKFTDAGRQLVLAAPNSRVRKLLALTSLDKLIDSAESVEEALQGS